MLRYETPNSVIARLMLTYEQRAGSPPYNPRARYSPRWPLPTTMTTKTVLTTKCTTDTNFQGPQSHRDTETIMDASVPLSLCGLYLLRVLRGLTIFVLSFMVSPVHAGQTEALAAPQLLVDLPADFDGPAPPISPAVISRDADGRATIRAVRVDAPMRIDGRLDEPLYTSVPPISDFIQQEPQEGSPATEKTEVWLAFDADNV